MSDVIEIETTSVVIESVTGVVGTEGPQGPAGATGPQGDPGVGVPTGGTTGQVLAKNSATDYDTEWVDQTGGGGGDVAWGDVTGKPTTFPPIIGSGAADAVAGNDSRLTDARTPTAHTHPWSEVTSKPTTFAPIIGSGSGDAVAGNDSRLTNARTPTPHKTSHAIGGSDVLTPSDIGAVAVVTPYNAGNKGGVNVQFNFNDGPVQYASLTNDAAITSILNGVSGSRLELWLTATGGQRFVLLTSGMAPIGYPSFDNIVPDGETAVFTFLKTGAFWRLVSFPFISVDGIYDLTAAGRSMATAADAAAQKTLLNLSGTNTGDQTDIAGNAETVTDIGNLTGVVTSTNRVTDIADDALSIAKTSGLQAALDAKATTSALTSHTSNTSNPHSVTKSQVGLGNVDNTTDLNKPISTATQSALDGKQATLVSATNIKTVNGTSLLGSGDVAISGGSVASTDITDSTSTGRSLITTASATAGRNTLGAQQSASVLFSATEHFFNGTTSVSMGLVSSTSGGSNSSTGAVGRQGVCRASTGGGGTANQRAGLLANATAISFNTGAGAIAFRMAATTFSILPNGTNLTQIRFGFLDSVTGESTDAVMFRALNSDQLECVTRSNNTETVTSAVQTLVLGTWSVYEILVSEAGDAAVFKIDGTTVATHTANIPTGANRQTGFGFYIHRVAAVGNTCALDVDWLNLEITSPAALWTP